MLCMNPFLLKAAGDITIYGDKNGYDGEVLKSYLMLTAKRQVLDLAGEWMITAEGISRKIQVPSCYDYSGIVIYKRTFIPDETFREKHFRLVCFGINYRCDIRINGEFIGNYDFGYGHIEEDIPEGLIQAGQANTIEIIVDSRVCGRNSIPTIGSVLQPKPYGGIAREIFLLALPKICIEKYAVDYQVSRDLRRCEFTLNMNFRDYGYRFELRDTLHSTLEERKPVRYLVEVFSEDEPEPVFTNRYKKYRSVWEIPKIRERNEENVLLMSNQSAVETRFTLEKPVFWNYSSPYRYRMVLSLMVADTLADQIQMPVGISQVQVVDKKIIFNSQSLGINGVEYYEDYFNQGNTLSYAVMEQDARKIKELGANAVYFKNHPPHPYFLELCNRYGLLVFYQIPVHYQTGDMLYREGYIEDVRNYYRNLIQRYRMNPCIAAWGIGDGLDFGDARANDYLSAIVPMIRYEDRRPVFATSYFGVTQDAFLQNVDIINLDIRNHVLNDINSFLSKQIARKDNNVLLLSYGQHIFSNNQNGYSDRTSTKFQAKFIADMFKRIQEMRITGGFIRSYNDFTVNRSYIYANPNADPTIYTTGLVTDKRKERYAYGIVKSIYTGDKYEPIPVGTAETVYPKTYPVVGLLLVIVFIVFYRKSEKFGGSIFRSITKVSNFFADVRENRVIAVWPSVVIVLLSSVTWSTMLSIIFFELRRNQILDETIALLIVSPAVKSWLDALTWQPELFVLGMSAFIGGLHFLAAALIKLFARFFKSSLSFQQALIAGFWSGSHHLLLIPCVILFQRLVNSDFFLVLAIIAVLAMTVWHLVRLLRIFKILYDASWFKTSLVFGGLLFLTLLFGSLHYASRYHGFDMMSLVYKMYASGNYLNE